MSKNPFQLLNKIDSIIDKTIKVADSVSNIESFSTFDLHKIRKDLIIFLDYVIPHDLITKNDTQFYNKCYEFLNKKYSLTNFQRSEIVQSLNYFYETDKELFLNAAKGINQ